MKWFWLVGLCFLITTPSLFAQEKSVERYNVHLGIMSWESIQAGNHVENSDLQSRQYKMAKEMATMHGGGAKGDYHVLIVIDDQDSGLPVEDAKVWVTASAPETKDVTATLERMDMAGYVGYGGYLSFTFSKPYTLRVFFNRRADPTEHEVEFSGLR